MKKFQLILGIALALLSTKVDSTDCRGKVDVGPAYIHMDVLESGKTVQTLHMGALKADSSLVFDYGITVKPGILLASNSKSHLAQAALGIGWCIPIIKEVNVMPSAGVSWGYFETHGDITVGDFKLVNLKEQIRSRSPYIGFEIVYMPTPSWTISGLVQYAWSRTHTDINTPLAKPFKKITKKDHSSGPSYAILVDYTINKKWTVNLGAAYNITLSKEKFGLRAAGVKAGVAYWF